MESDRLTLLEQRLVQVETELTTSHRLIEELRQGATRSRSLGHLTSVVAACGLIAILAITVGTATAAPGPKSLTIKTPFEVQNQAGQVIFRIVEQSSSGAGIAKLYDGSGKVLVALQSNESGESGELAIRGPKDGQIARLGGNKGDLSLRFYTGATFLGGVGDTPSGGVLQLNDTAGKTMAKVSNNGQSGVVSLFGGDGNPKVLISNAKDTNGGALTLYGATGGPAVTMHATAAAGYFGIANAAGTARVEAGVLDGDKGIVRAFGPKAFDFISGK